ncbi:MAG: GntR family transcriptional regulator [Erysipelotrichaceae bacterium]|jgi:GntR family transcriptional regulator
MINNKKKKISKRQIIINYLLSEINNGNFKVGDRIPSEAELCKKFNFGRQTVHSALSDIALMGIIERTPGKGSFVSQNPVNKNIQKKRSFTEDMESIGMKAGSRLMEFRIIKAKEVPKIAKELKVNPSDSLYYLVRLRFGNNIPIALQYTYFPVKFIPKFDVSVLEKSLDAYAEDLGFIITGFYTRLRAVEGTDYQIKILETDSKAILNSISIRYIENEVPFQYTSSFYRSDLYEYTFSSFR